MPPETLSHLDFSLLFTPHCFNFWCLYLGISQIYGLLSILTLIPLWSIHHARLSYLHDLNSLQVSKPVFASDHCDLPKGSDLPKYANHILIKPRQSLLFSFVALIFLHTCEWYMWFWRYIHEQTWFCLKGFQRECPESKQAIRKEYDKSYDRVVSREPGALGGCLLEVATFSLVLEEWTGST